MVAPFGYMWAALWGADHVRIQIANCVLFLLCVLMLWRSATRIAGFWAGVTATMLLVGHPGLVNYIPQVLTESLYLFGIMLFLLGATEYLTDSAHRYRYLWLASTGLSITLLSRPVLQTFTVVALIVTITGVLYLRRRATAQGRSALQTIINAPLCWALALALLLPIATAIKNGLCFDVWSISTGAGSGLSYGVSPFKMGMEPVYSGFHYDAVITPFAVDPRVEGNPLTKRADAINTQVALEIIKRTTLKDNASFFAFKLKAWLLYSTPDLTIRPAQRALRWFEWLIITSAAVGLILRCCPRGKLDAWSLEKLQLPGAQISVYKKLTAAAMLLGLVFAMALQLTPVLYNERYNNYFMEPWLILLSGIAAGILLQRSGESSAGYRQQLFTKNSALRWRTSISLYAVALIAILIATSVALTIWAMRYETFAIDPQRTGPTEVVLQSKTMGTAYAEQAEPLSPNRWRIGTSPASVAVNLPSFDPANLDPKAFMDGIWRVRLAVLAPKGSSACRHALFSISNAHPALRWYSPEPVLNLRADGKMHTYAIHGNDNLRPSGPGKIIVTFQCPEATEITWGGAELLRVTTPEAARALILHNQPINPYRSLELQ